MALKDLFAPEVVRSLGCEAPIANSTVSLTPTSTIISLIRLIRTIWSISLKPCKSHLADLGLGIDGDGDRLGVVDSSGNTVTPTGRPADDLVWRKYTPPLSDSPLH